MSEVKETKAQRAERLKREVVAWEHLDKIREFARTGYDSIPPEWLTTYLRTWGIYTQGDGAGALGGKGGEGKAVPYFMVRIRVPNGLISSEQLRTVAELTRDHARGIADITVRQNFQLHWVTIESLPEVIDRLAASGLATIGACGDVARNVTGCPLAGVGDEWFDASPVTLEMSEFFEANAEYYNLPRKYKLSVTACKHWCSYPEINDVGFTGVIRTRNGELERGFTLRVGGGLSNQPHLAVKLDAFIPERMALPVARAVTEIFRDADELRQSRDRARLKYLFMSYGWTAESMLAEIESRLGYKFDPAEPEEVPVGVFRDHTGIHPQRQPGFSYVGTSVMGGRLTADQLFAAADLARQFGDGQMRTTASQNLIFVNIPNQNAEPLAQALREIGLHVETSTFWRGAVACTGTEFCKLAITETKGFTRWLVEELEGRLPGFDEQLRLNVTGCPNSCGQHWIADIGLEGKKLKVDGVMQDAYYFCVGGGVGQQQAIARPVGYRVLSTEVPDAIERLLARFVSERDTEENLRQFLGRHSNEEIRAFLAGEPLAPVDRDLPSGRVPHGVEA